MNAGRPKKVRFPIQRTEVAHGTPIVRTVEENTTVRCVQCGEKFLINYDTVYISRDEINSEVEMVRCPHCNRRASIYHFYDQIGEKPKKSI